MMRLATEKDVKIDLTSLWENVVNPWDHLVHGNTSRITSTMINLGYELPLSVEG